MYCAYLVDDEELVLDSMEASIKWDEYAIRIIGRNTDPLAALEEITQLRPEVVFTDISMPEMDGVQLAAKMREQGIDCEIVVISAYDKFEYARKIMQLQGFDYLVKPIDEPQYNELLARLTAKLDKKYAHKYLPSTASDELNQIILHLNRSITHKHSLKQIAQKFGIHPNYVCNLFSKHLHTTFSAYLTRIRMETAAHMLEQTDKPVKEIALGCGYEDYFYFCRVFRDYYAKTPTQFRAAP